MIQYMVSGKNGICNQGGVIELAENGRLFGLQGGPTVHLSFLSIRGWGARNNETGQEKAKWSTTPVAFLNNHP